jgi:beta-barrel assembly-enhancing protease
MLAMLPTLSAFNPMNRSANFWRFYRRIAYGVMAFVVTLSIGLVNPQPSQAGLLDLLFQGIQVYQLTNMSDRNEIALGRQVNTQLTNSEFRVYNNAAITGYVNAVGQRLVPHSDRSSIPYIFQVIQDDSVNAFATMGGYVYVTTGLLRTASNESELAGVIGHEIGHIAHKDALEGMKQAAIAQGIAGAVGLNRNQMVGLAVQVALELPASREAEYEADQHGFTTMGEAGYSQAGMVSFMQKLVREGTPPEFLSTHPDARNRVTALQTMLSESGIATATDGTSTSSYTSQLSSLR